jgi:hypothetical protein
MAEKFEYQSLCSSPMKKLVDTPSNAGALKPLGVDPAEARQRGYPLKELENPKQI